MTSEKFGNVRIEVSVLEVINVLKFHGQIISITAFMVLHLWLNHISYCIYGQKRISRYYQICEMTKFEIL